MNMQERDSKEDKKNDGVLIHSLRSPPGGWCVVESTLFALLVLGGDEEQNICAGYREPHGLQFICR